MDFNLDKSIVFFDIEATGLNVLKDRIVQIALIKYLPLQQGDVEDTISDISKISKLGYQPLTNIRTGVKNFLDWYLEYHQ